MSQLKRFTLNDRVCLQDILDLPIESIEEYGELYTRLWEVEERDRRLGTDIVATIKQSLTELSTIRNKIAENQYQSNYGVSELEEEIDEEYKIKIKYGSKKQTIDFGLKARQEFLILQIKRDLNWLNQAKNKICLG